MNLLPSLFAANNIPSWVVNTNLMIKPLKEGKIESPTYPKGMEAKLSPHFRKKAQKLTSFVGLFLLAEMWRMCSLSRNRSNLTETHKSQGLLLFWTTRAQGTLLHMEIYLVLIYNRQQVVYIASFAAHTTE